MSNLHHCKCGNITKSICQRCKAVYYCSKDCQKIDWPTHKLVCAHPTTTQKIKSTRWNSLDDYFKTFGNCVEVIENKEKGRVVWARKEFKTNDIIFEEEKPILRGDNSFSSFEKAIHNIVSSTKILAVYKEEVINLAKTFIEARQNPNYWIDPNCIWDLRRSTVGKYTSALFDIYHELPQNVKQHISLEELVKLVETSATNAHSLSNNVGMVIYALGSMLSHSCIPNSRFSTEGIKFRLHALKPIQPGEELTISYSLKYLPIIERKALLLEHYGFECTCIGCLPQSIDKSRAFKCPSKGCNGIVYPIGYTPSTPADFGCNKCYNPLSQDSVSNFLNKENIAKEICKDVGSAEDIIREGILHESHYILFNTIDKFIQFLTEPIMMVRSANRLLRCAIQIYGDDTAQCLSYYSLVQNANKFAKNPKKEQEARAALIRIIKKCWGPDSERLRAVT